MCVYVCPGEDEDELAHGAAQDATRAIELKPDWNKGYYRKSAALRAVGDINGEAENVLDAIQNVPTDSWAEREVRGVEVYVAVFVCVVLVKCVVRISVQCSVVCF